LNEPAGNVAKIVISYAVTQVVAAWSNENVDPRGAVESILTCFCHPALLNPQSQLHSTMMATVKLWVDNVLPERKQRMFQGLSREGVRQGLHHDNEMTVRVEAQMSYSQQTVVTQFQGSRDIQDTMSSVVQSSIVAQQPTIYQSPSFATTQQLFTNTVQQQSFNVQSPVQSVSFKHDQMANPQRHNYLFNPPPQPQSTPILSRSVVPDPVIIQSPPTPAIQVPTSLFFRHDQMSNPGHGAMYIRPAPPPPRPVPVISSRDIMPPVENTPPLIQVQPPPPQVPQSLEFRHDQMSNPGNHMRQQMTAQTGALAPVNRAVSTVEFSSNRSVTYGGAYRSTTVTADFSPQARLPVVRPHNPYDYSLIYEMAKRYANSNFSLEGSFLAQRQDTSYDGMTEYENADEGPSEGLKPITRMWPYNTSPYHRVGSGENYVGSSYAQPQYNEKPQPGQNNPTAYDQITPTAFNQNNPTTYDQNNPTPYTSGPYNNDGQGQNYGNSESTTTRLQENFANLSVKEVPLSFIS
jgi:Heterokaryon incompatibility protein Het-C